MPISPDWDAAQAIQRCSVITYAGSAWSIHKQHYRADDPGGSLKVSGRYHRGLDAFPESMVWRALYVALSPETALAELVRHVAAELLTLLNDYLLTALKVELRTVLVDFCAPFYAARFTPLADSEWALIACRRLANLSLRTAEPDVPTGNVRFGAAEQASVFLFQRGLVGPGRGLPGQGAGPAPRTPRRTRSCER